MNSKKDLDELEPVMRGRVPMPPGPMAMMMVDATVLEHIECLAAKKGISVQIWVQNALKSAAKEQGFDLVSGKEI